MCKDLTVLAARFSSFPFVAGIFHPIYTPESTGQNKII
jgi:hypothetical protein